MQRHAAPGPAGPGPAGPGPARPRRGRPPSPVPERSAPPSEPSKGWTRSSCRAADWPPTRRPPGPPGTTTIGSRCCPSPPTRKGARASPRLHEVPRRLHPHQRPGPPRQLSAPTASLQKPLKDQGTVTTFSTCSLLGYRRRRGRQWVDLAAGTASRALLAHKVNYQWPGTRWGGRTYTGRGQAGCAPDHARRRRCRARSPVSSLACRCEEEIAPALGVG